jgi:hypothetical protein
VQLETRLKGIDLVVHVFAGRSSTPSPEKHPGNSLAYDEIAPGYSLAAEEVGWSAVVRQLGKDGETAANIVKNTERIPSATKTANYRIPDVLDDAAEVLGEVKKVGRLSYTNQLKDFAAEAQANGTKFHLWVRPTTKLSGPLDAEIASGRIILRYLP